jgi:hypothetical protein
MHAALWAVAGGTVSLALVVLTLRSKAVDPLPGLLLAAGVALLSAANAVALVDGGSPSYADVPGLLAYPALAAAVTAFQRDRVRRDRDSLLDALVVTVAAAQVGWLVLLEPVLTDSSSELSTTVLTGAYALCNLLVLGVSARLGFALLASHDVTGRLLISGLLVGVASDVTASLTEVKAFELGWLAAFALLVLAVHQPGMAAPEPRPAPPSLVALRRPARPRVPGVSGAGADPRNLRRRDPGDRGARRRGLPLHPGVDPDRQPALPPPTDPAPRARAA